MWECGNVGTCAEAPESLGFIGDGGRPVLGVFTWTLTGGSGTAAAGPAGAPGSGPERWFPSYGVSAAVVTCKGDVPPFPSVSTHARSS